MNWQYRALDLISPLYKPQRDRGRAARVYRQFDDARGFGRYTRICRERSGRQQADASRLLSAAGVEHVVVMGPEQAARLLARIAAGHRPGPVKKKARWPSGFRIRDPALRREVLESVLTATIDERIAGFFGSEYLVLWMTVSATAPDQTTVSFRWHCDKGPRNHLKLIVYLNGSGEHGGNTAFIPLGDTARVAACGYLFGRMRARTADLARLSELAGRPLHVTMAPIAAGEGVLFQPAAVLHRGVVPTRGIRYAVTLCLLPSPVPWRVALERGVIADLAVDEKWPAHADRLLEALDAV